MYEQIKIELERALDLVLQVPDEVMTAKDKANRLADLVRYIHCLVQTNANIINGEPRPKHDRLP